MDEQKESNFLSTDWVRCQSKSRPDRYYMFNKKTGETNWCHESVINSPQKTVSSKDIVKTPAQDRLKRLQSNLQKKKLNEPIAGTKKGGRRTKSSKQEKPNVKGLGKSSDIGSVSTQSLDKKLEVKPTTSEKDQTSLTPFKHKSLVSVQSRLDITKEEKSLEPKSGSKEHKFVIPKKTGSKTKSKPFEGTKIGCDTKVTPTEPRIEPKHSPGELFCTATESSKSNSISLSENTVGALAKGSRSSVGQSQNSTKYDVNSNETPSKEAPKSGGYFDKVKELYNKLISVATRPRKRKPPDDKEKEKQVSLSIHSKATFKFKTKPDIKNVVRGILQENESGSTQGKFTQFLPKNLPTSPKVSSPIPVPNESANARLQRLRNSLNIQQAPQSLTPTPASATSSPLDLLSKDSNVGSNINSSNASASECEPMDWQPISEEYTNISITSSSLSDVRSEDSSTHSEHYDTVNENLLRLAAEKKQQKHWKPDHFYFVVDTNVFLQNVTFVEELTAMKLCDTLGTVIYVPYCVLQELDKLKIRSPSESIKTRSVRAIKYLNKSFDEKDQKIQAQSAADEAKHLIKVTSPDDSILNCCLQVKEHINNVLLLTEDINLQNKAMCCDVLVSTKSDLISKH